MKKYTVSISVEKVLEYEVFAKNEEEAIELANQKAMNGNEDFAVILNSCIIDNEEMEDK